MGKNLYLSKKTHLLCFWEKMEYFRTKTMVSYYSGIVQSFICFSYNSDKFLFVGDHVLKALLFGMSLYFTYQNCFLGFKWTD